MLAPLHNKNQTLPSLHNHIFRWSYHRVRDTPDTVGGSVKRVGDDWSCPVWVRLVRCGGTYNWDKLCKICTLKLRTHKILSYLVCHYILIQFIIGQYIKYIAMQQIVLQFKISMASNRIIQSASWSWFVVKWLSKRLNEQVSPIRLCTN